MQCYPAWERAPSSAEGERERETERGVYGGREVKMAGWMRQMPQNWLRAGESLFLMLSVVLKINEHSVCVCGGHPDVRKIICGRVKRESVMGNHANRLVPILDRARFFFFFGLSLVWSRVSAWRCQDMLLIKQTVKWPNSDICTVVQWTTTFKGFLDRYSYSYPLSTSLTHTRSREWLMLGDSCSSLMQ